MNGIQQFITKKREPYICPKPSVRSVYISELKDVGNNGNLLREYLADRAPIYYRNILDIAHDLADGYFLTAIKATLQRLPTSQSFQESHFGEITAADFAEGIGLRKIYSKLTLLTSENANAYKMDLVLYDPNTDPITLVFGEVKSSAKRSEDGLPVGHDSSCYAAIFNSLNHYELSDLEFDLQAARDRVEALPEPEKQRLRQILLPYANRQLKYAAYAVIDVTTKYDDEMTVLATRKNDKNFDIDVICLEDYPGTSSFVYEKLDMLRQYV